MQPVRDGLLNNSAAMVGQESLIAADLTDIAKYYARHLEGLGRVRDGSDPEKRTAPGYMFFEAYVRVRCWRLDLFGDRPIAGIAEPRTVVGVSWRNAEAAPLMLLVSPQARKAGRNGTWFVRAFRRRWGVEDATWGIKQRFHFGRIPGSELAQHSAAD